MAPKTKQISGRRKSKIGIEAIDSISHAVAAVSILQDDEDFYREPIKRIVRPDNQVKKFAQHM